MDYDVNQRIKQVLYKMKELAEEIDLLTIECKSGDMFKYLEDIDVTLEKAIDQYNQI